MDRQLDFEYSGSKLKRIIPQIFKWNLIVAIVGVVVTFLSLLFEADVEDAFLALLVCTLGAAVEIGVLYFWLLNLYAHAEQSENSFRILQSINSSYAPIPPIVPAAPTQPAPVAQPVQPVYDVPAAKPIVKPEEKKEEAKPAPAPEKVPPKPLEKIKLSSFGEALSFALRFETDEGMRRQLLRLTEQEEFSSYREELLDILEEVPSAQQRSATEALLQKYS